MRAFWILLLAVGQASGSVLVNWSQIYDASSVGSAANLRLDGGAVVYRLGPTNTPSAAFSAAGSFRVDSLAGVLFDGTTTVQGSIPWPVTNGVVSVAVYDNEASVSWVDTRQDSPVEVAWCLGSFFAGMGLVCSTCGFLGYARSVARRLAGQWHRMEV